MVRSWSLTWDLNVPSDLGWHGTVEWSQPRVEWRGRCSKALPLLFDPRGPIVILDSDMIVIDHLGPVVLKATEGKICVFPDHISQTGRWFPEWQSVLGLIAPLRRQTYVNSGFIALSVDHWPSFLPRFWDLSERVPLDRSSRVQDMDRPFWTADQDTLNALLMSEIPPTAVEILPRSDQVYPDGLMDTKVVESRDTRMHLGGSRPNRLHHSMNPKVWARGGWRRVRRDAYGRLFARVVCGQDAPLRMRPEELPLWLRPDALGRMTLRDST